jgi:hypothetical protein
MTIFQCVAIGFVLALTLLGAWFFSAREQIDSNRDQEQH